MGMFFNEDINTLFVGGSGVSAAYAGNEQVWPSGLPSGTVFNFEYTGDVQSIELPRGKYKLQCWGAQGGDVAGTYAVNGSKGGYSEGVLTLREKTTLYVFVGGQGASYTSSASQTSTSVVNGGWNGGGAGVRTSRYSTSSEDGRSFPRGGGGATDISTVTSTMSYSSGRTNRSSASLLARCIVAGGGAGASARYTSETTSSTVTDTVVDRCGNTYMGSTGNPYCDRDFTINAVAGRTYEGTIDMGNCTFYDSGSFAIYNTSWSVVARGNQSSQTFNWTCSSSGTYYVIIHCPASQVGQSICCEVIESYTTSSSSTSSSKSNTNMQGGGTSGEGQYPGKATSAGNGGAFGLGANQSSTNYKYCGGGGGGGWYGGGTNKSDSSADYVNHSGGGSGFVNTSANASSRPSGYTGLQLDSGTTTPGSSSFESVSGGRETGHSGNGYARITVL